MPANEVQVTINGAVTIVFNDYGSGTPAYVLRDTPELLASPEPRVTKTERQGEHGVYDSLSYYNERILPFSGEIIGSSQADRKAKENDLKRCLALRELQSAASADGYLLVQITDEDGSLKQCYAKIISPVKFNILDDIDPSRRGFSFVMMAKDPRLYSQTLKTETGVETYQGTNFSVIQGVSPSVPFSLIQNTVVSATCENEGTFDAPPAITVSGPTVSPRVTNVTTGEYIELTGLTVEEGQSVTIDVGKRTIKLDDGTDVSAYFATGSTWWVLVVGENEITLLDDSPSLLEATLQVQWRDTYI